MKKFTWNNLTEAQQKEAIAKMSKYTSYLDIFTKGEEKTENEYLVDETGVVIGFTNETGMYWAKTIFATK